MREGKNIFFALRTCHGTMLVVEEATGQLSHGEGIPLLLRMTGERSGALARADGGSIRLSRTENGRFVACVLSNDLPEAAFWLSGNRLLTPLPGGGVAFDRIHVGGWELVRAEATLLGECAFSPLDAYGAIDITSPDLPAEIVAVRLPALSEAALREAAEVFVRRPDYDRIFPAIRLALTRGQARSVWHSRAHLAAGIAAYGWDVGDHTYGAPTIVDGEYGMLRIGRYCSIASEVRIVLANHATETATTYPFAALRRYWPSAPDDVADHVGAGVEIGHNVWIGAGATILPGARIGDGAIVGAEAVVAREVPPYCVVVGNPARVTRQRFDDVTVARMLELRWWDWPDDKVDRFVPLLLSEDLAAFLEAAEREAANDEASRAA